MSQTLHRRLIPRTSLALTTSLATTPAIDNSHSSGGGIGVPAGSPITSLTFYAAVWPGNSYNALQDGNGNAVVLTVAAGNAYPLPAACVGFGGLKIIPNAAGPVDVALKS
jgi:hypothetical protein